MLRIASIITRLDTQQLQDFHIFLLCLSILLMACTPTTEAVVIDVQRPEKTQNVYQSLLTEERFSTFTMMLERAELLSILQESPEVTVFTVPNSVFDTLPQTELNALIEDKEKLQGMLSQHIVLDTLTGLTLRNAAVICEDWGIVTMLSGETFLYGSDRHEQDTIDKIPIIEMDILADNGRIHVLSAPLVSYDSPLRIKNVRQAIPYNRAKKMSTALYNIGGPYDTHHVLSRDCPVPDLVEKLVEPGSYTVFAPTDEAFLAFESEHLIQLQDNHTLAQIVPYHILPNITLDNKQSDLSTYNTLLDETINVVFSSPEQVQINGQTVQIIKQYKATNGIVYLIDSIITPPSFPLDSYPSKTLWNTLQDEENLSQIAVRFKYGSGIGIDGFHFPTSLQDWGPYTVVAPSNAIASNFNEYDLQGHVFHDILPPDSPELSRFTIIETIHATNGVIYVIDTLPSASKYIVSKVF